MPNRRQDILATAYDMMGMTGLESVHARTVAAQLNINHATVHYYFKHRTDLLQGVADYALGQLLDDRKTFQEDLTTPRERVEAEIALAEAYSRKASRFVKVLAGLYVAAIADPALRKKVRAVWTAWAEFSATQLAAAKTRKDSPYTDPEMLAITFFGLGLSSHLMDGKLDTRAKAERITASLFGPG